MFQFLSLTIVALPFMYAYAGSVGDSSYGTVSEGTSNTYSEASDWSYDGGSSSSSSGSHYGSYYEHTSTTYERSRDKSHGSSYGGKQEMPSLKECAQIAVFCAIICCILYIMFICEKMSIAKREREEAERVVRRRARIEELVK